ncbi:hypothetical protein MP228_009464 [Amoeboaphelidium protococcarum]|nr:hypothetical protein MP228_009464 [Amoeboaphelidium protococcarum]
MSSNVKVNPSGVQLWKVNFGHAAVVTCNSAIAVSQSTGDVYVSGSFTFGDDVLNGQKTPIGLLGIRDSTNQLYTTQQSNTNLKSALFLAKLNSAGVFQWLVRIDDSQPQPNSLSVSPNGNVVLVGQYQNTAYPLGFYDTSGQLVRSVNPSRVMLSGFVATYSPQGSLIYVATMEGAGDDQAVHCAVDTNSNVYVAAQFSSSSAGVVDGLGTKWDIPSSPSTVLKFSPSGKLLYSFRGTGISVREILKGYDNSLILAGNFSGASKIFDSSGNNGLDLPSSGSGYVFAKYLDNGFIATTTSTTTTTTPTTTTTKTTAPIISYTTSKSVTTTPSVTTLIATTTTTTASTTTTTTTTIKTPTTSTTTTSITTPTTTTATTTTTVTTNITSTTTTSTPASTTTSVSILSAVVAITSMVNSTSYYNVSKVSVVSTSGTAGQMSNSAPSLNQASYMSFAWNSNQHSSSIPASTSRDDDVKGQVQPGTQSSMMPLYIIIIAIVCVLILLLVLLSMYCIRRRYIKSRMRSSKMLLLRNFGGMTDQTLNATIGTAIQTGGTAMGGTTFMNTSMEVAVPAYLELKRDLNFRMVPNSFINKGGQAEIQVAEVFDYPAGHPYATSGAKFVAAKCFIGNVQRDSIHQEIALMWRFQGYDQIAKLVGFDGQNNVLLMINYELGSLEQLILNRAQAVDYSFDLQAMLCFDVITALVVLHQNAVVHNDIKSGNYLVYKDVNDDFRVALTDFGICTLLSRANVVQGMQWNQLKGHSVKYAAPEVLSKLQVPEQLLPARDVYAGAVVMFEILGRRKAWESYKAVQVSEMVLSGIRPEAKFSDNRAQMLYQIIQLAWTQDPSMRPTAAAIAGEIQKFAPA